MTVKPIDYKAFKTALDRHAREQGFDNLDARYEAEHAANLASDGDGTARLALRYIDRDLARGASRAVKRDQAARMADARWGNETEAVRSAVMVAMEESGRAYPSKRETARRIADRVNEILMRDGIAPRSERAIRRFIP